MRRSKCSQSRDIAISGSAVRFPWRLGQFAACAIAWWLACLVEALPAQQNYGAYFTQQGKQYGGQLGTQTSSRYLYDKYFYQRPSVSPYINLARPDTMSGTSYQAYVRPEQQRRAAQYQAQTAYVDQLKRSGKVGGMHDPSASIPGFGAGGYRPPSPSRSAPSAYYNHWYGNRNR
jgi:hypothetical protein